MNLQPHLKLTFLIALITAPTFAQDSLMTTQQAIKQHRMGTIVIHGQPGDQVTVTQLRHEFMFGTAIASHMFKDNVDPVVQKKYLDIIKNNFNAAVHENAMKWYETERQEGQVTYQTADRILNFCEENNIQMRGHCLMWCVDKFIQDWIKQLDDDALQNRVEQRIRQVVKRYRGRIVEYDVNNEMLHGSYYKKRLGEDIRTQMFQWAKQEDPDAKLFVNDYGILPGGKWTDLYQTQIQSLLDDGAPVGGIGCQGHFSDKWPPDSQKIKMVLDKLERFGLPIVITEFDMAMDDQQKKAQALEDVYRISFAHPAVTGILMWGFWEGAHWRPNAALWKKDFTETPAAKTYRDLVFNKWWTNYSGKIGDDGLRTVQVFYGQHEVTVGGEKHIISVSKGQVDVTIDSGK